MRSFATTLCSLGLLGALAAGCPEVPLVVPPVPPVVAAPGALGPAPLRRLTEEELNNTFRDLFTVNGVAIALPFVPLNDGEGDGYDGDVSRQTPSDLVVEQLRAGAIGVSAAAVARKDVLLSRLPSGDVADQRAVGEGLIARLAPRAFRRPADAAEIESYAAFFRRQLEEHNFDVALELVLQAIVQSPSFLYRPEIGGGPADEPGVDDAIVLGPFEVASRLSYLLWSTMPDELLTQAALEGQLATSAQIEAQARRMLADDRAHDAVRSFHRQWLDLDAVLTANKDAATFPEWNDALRRSLREEADALIEDVIFGGGDGKLASLLTTTTTRADAAVAALYGIAAPANDWDLVELPGAQRAGLVTSGAFLASRAHQVNGSPVLRGVFVLDRLLCEKPPAPDASIDTTPPDASEQPEPTTNRARYAQHTTDTACQGCHAGIDGVGFGLEGYDAIGRFRTTDSGFPVDDSGNLEGTSLGGTFAGGPELARLLADSSLVQDCVARQWLTWSRGRLEERNDASHDAAVLAAFAAAQGDVRELLIAIAVSPAFRTMPARGAP